MMRREGDKEEEEEEGGGGEGEGEARDPRADYIPRNRAWFRQTDTL